MRALLAAIALALPSSGCALLFQEHLQPRYNPRDEEPHCSAGSGLAVLDVVLAGGNVLLAFGATQIDTTGNAEAKKQKDIYIASSVLGGVVHAISAGIGVEWASECERARGQRAAYMKERLEVGRTTRRRSFFRQRAEPKPLQGNGFFCSSINCARDLETCQSNRLPDEQPCSAQATAFCFGNTRYRVCRPTMAACERQLDVSGYGSTTACDEMR